jgi:hypothetical protein
LKRQPRNPKADRVIGRIAKKIERIGLERARVCRDPGTNFDKEHPGIENDRDPQDTTPSRVI